MFSVRMEEPDKRVSFAPLAGSGGRSRASFTTLIIDEPRVHH